eukprot:972209-Pelagomonas_calceolata.AAC.1
MRATPLGSLTSHKTSLEHAWRKTTISIDPDLNVRHPDRDLKYDPRINSAAQSQEPLLPLTTSVLNLVRKVKDYQ